MAEITVLVMFTEHALEHYGPEALEPWQKSGPLGFTNYLYDGLNVVENVDNGGNVLVRYTRIALPIRIRQRVPIVVVDCAGSEEKSMAELNSPGMVAAMNALENKDYPLAFTLLVPLAEAGNPKAQCNLATLYHFGLGVKADGEKAVELYRGVAEQDTREEHLSGIAYNNLATIFICGFASIEPDPQKATEYRNRAKALGFEM